MSSSENCKHCRFDDPAALLQCGQCLAWFCNALDPQTKVAHIVMHLKRSGHKRVVFHSAAAVSDRHMRCSGCGSPNIFTLGFDQTLVCRSCLIQNGTSRLSEWKPVVVCNAISQDLVATPEPRPRSGDVKESKVMPASKPLPKIRLKYEHPRQYLKVFVPLVTAEARYQQKIKEAYKHSNTSIQWVNDHYEGKIRLENKSARIEVGMQLSLVSTLDEQTFKGTILRINQKSVVINFDKRTYQELSRHHANEKFRVFDARSPSVVLAGNKSLEITEVIKYADLQMDKYALGLRLKKGMMLTVQNEVTKQIRTGTILKVMPNRIRLQISKAGVQDLRKECEEIGEESTYLVSLILTSTVYHRLITGLQRLVNSSNRKLLDVVLGHRKIEVVTSSAAVIVPPNSAPLNQSQELAVRKVRGSDLLSIQGPPGTGKTTTATAIVYNLVKTGGKVLVAAPSNNAADQFATHLRATGLIVTRFYSAIREELPNLPHKDVSFSKKCNTLLKEGIAANQASQKVLNDTEVLVCTCVGSFDKQIAKFRAHAVVIDECTQATEPETLLPILCAPRKVVLIGDHQQLSAITLCPKASKAGLFRSLFDRLTRLGNEPHLLEVQYRMHPKISAVSKALYYNNRVRDDTAETRLVRPWKGLGSPFIFWHVESEEELSGSGTSYINRVECQRVLDAIAVLSGQGIAETRIEVISFYEGQQDFLETCLAANNRRRIRVNTVDSFQGRENDYIILTCARSSPHGNIGFLDNPRRLNVAITRAKFGLLIVGNARILQRSGVWHDLLTYLTSFNLIFKGAVNQLRPASIKLSERKPQGTGEQPNPYADLEDPIS